MAKKAAAKSAKELRRKPPPRLRRHQAGRKEGRCQDAGDGCLPELSAKPA